MAIGGFVRKFQQQEQPDQREHPAMIRKFMRHDTTSLSAPRPKRPSICPASVEAMNRPSTSCRFSYPTLSPMKASERGITAAARPYP